jgi:hypothetical protein
MCTHNGIPVGADARSVDGGTGHEVLLQPCNLLALAYKLQILADEMHDSALSTEEACRLGKPRYNWPSLSPPIPTLPTFS